jgi:RecB family exonuclease
VTLSRAASVRRKRFGISLSTSNFLLSDKNRWYYHPTKFGIHQLIVKVHHGL